MGNPKTLSWNAVQSINRRPRYLDQQWAKEDPNIGKGNVYEQTLAALHVLADSYGNNGYLDAVNVKYVLTSCGEEMSDDEFDEALRRVGQSSKGLFGAKRMLDAYAALSYKVGRKDAQMNYAPTKQVLDKSTRLGAAAAGPQPAAADSRRGSCYIGGDIPSQQMDHDPSEHDGSEH